MSQLDGFTDATLELYNCKLQVMRKMLEEAGITVTENEIAEKARAIMAKSTSNHPGDIPDKEMPDINDADSFDG